MELVESKEYKFLQSGDTAQFKALMASICIPLATSPILDSVVFAQDTSHEIECGSYMVKEINEALTELEDWDNLPKFNTVEEFLSSLKK